MFRTSVRALVLSSVVALVGCGVHTTEGMAKALVSDEQEAQLGAQVKQELEKQGKFPKRVSTSPGRYAYIEAEIDSYVEQKIAERDAVQAA